MPTKSIEKITPGIMSQVVDVAKWLTKLGVEASVPVCAKNVPDDAILQIMLAQYSSLDVKVGDLPFVLRLIKLIYNSNRSYFSLPSVPQFPYKYAETRTDRITDACRLGLLAKGLNLDLYVEAVAIDERHDYVLSYVDELGSCDEVQFKDHGLSFVVSILQVVYSTHKDHFDHKEDSTCHKT